MDELQWIRGALADRRLSVIAEKTGVSEPTIRAIRDSSDGNPKVKTLQRLAEYLRETARLGGSADMGGSAHD